MASPASASAAPAITGVGPYLGAVAERIAAAVGARGGRRQKHAKQHDGDGSYAAVHPSLSL